MTDPGPDAEFEPFLAPTEPSDPVRDYLDLRADIAAESQPQEDYEPSPTPVEKVMAAAHEAGRITDAEYERFRLATSRRDAEVSIAVQRAYQRGYEDGRNAETGWRGSVQEQALGRPTSAPEFGDHFDGYERLMETTGVGGARRWEDVKAQRAHDDEVRRRTQEYWAAVTRSRAERRGIKPIFCGACMAGIKHRHGDAVPEYQGEQE
jgi:hypothetical protein